jgi:ubiquinone/menaquinone biosynthesis C-methylase UbiE
MPDLIFSELRLAALYDACNPPGEGNRFYLDLAGETPIRVLDMGCGTGVLACALAERGHAVTGTDPALGMLSVARNRPGADAVAWIESDAAGLSVADRFDLVIMTGHVFQVFLTDEDIAAALRTLRAHLSPAGRIAFETRNPAAEEWREWEADASRERLHVDGIGELEVCWDVTDLAPPYVTFDTRYRFPDGEEAVSPSTLRFMGQDELAAHLAAAGLEAQDWYGDWDRSPVTVDSSEIIVIAR